MAIEGPFYAKHLPLVATPIATKLVGGGAGWGEEGGGGGG